MRTAAAELMRRPCATRVSPALQLGIYKSRCGLQHVFMSWGAPEFLYLVLSLNLTRLPPEALFLLRCQKLHSLTKSGRCASRGA